MCAGVTECLFRKDDVCFSLFVNMARDEFDYGDRKQSKRDQVSKRFTSNILILSTPLSEWDSSRSGDYAESKYEN